MRIDHDHFNTTLEAALNAIDHKDIEVRVAIDNFDEFRVTFLSILHAFRAEGVLDEEKTRKSNDTREKLVQNPSLVIELTNGSAVVFKMTDRALAQASLQATLDGSTRLQAAWAMMNDTAREALLQANVKGVQKLRAEMAKPGYTLPKGPAKPASTFWRM